MPQSRKKPLMRCLGEFVGHIIQGVKADPSVQRREVRREVEEETRDTPEGKVTLRRTTVEEIELHADPPHTTRGNP